MPSVKAPGGIFADTLCWESQMTRPRVQARHLKKGMLIRPKAGHVIVVREFDYKVPGVKSGELGFTVMRSSYGYYIRLASSLPPENILDENSPVMYCETLRIKEGKRRFTKHVFLAGSNLIYLHSNSCRGLEPVTN